jgi:hypothetical protein
MPVSKEGETECIQNGILILQMSIDTPRLLSSCLFCLLITAQNARAQNVFSTYFGFGLGRHFEQTFPYFDEKSNGRIALLVNPSFRLSPRISVGVSVMASGRLSAIGGAPAPSNYYDPITNTQIINFNNQNAVTYLIKTKYTWFKKRDFTIYSDLGVGVSRYRYVHAVQSTVSIAPEIGFSKGSFQFAVFFIGGGKTPAFTANSVFPDATVLSSIKSNRLYVTVSYRLNF